MKGRRLEVRKGALESKGLKGNVKKTKIMSCHENAGKVTEEGKFHCVVCKKIVSSNSILCQVLQVLGG